MREIVVEEKIVEFAEKQGWLVRKMVYAGRRGCPDRWFFRNGKIVIIEFKKPGKEPDGLQAREIKKLREHGIRVHVIDNIADGCELLV